MAGFRIFGVKTTGTVIVPLSTGAFKDVYSVGMVRSRTKSHGV